MKVHKVSAWAEMKHSRYRTSWKACRNACLLVIVVSMFAERQVLWVQPYAEEELAITESSEISRDIVSGSSVKKPPRGAREASKIPIIFTGPLPGGIGNQLSCAFQSIGIARRHHFEYYFPPLRTRKGLHPVSPDSVFDLSNVRKFVPKLHTVLPAVCNEENGGKYDIQIVLDYVSPPSNTSLTPDRKQLRSRNGVRINMRRYSLDAIADLDGEIRRVLDSRPRRERDLDSHRPAICVHAGIHAARPDYSIAPAFLPSKKYRDAAGQWPLERMAVIHLRYDEHIRACGKGPPKGVDPLHHVCLLRHRQLKTYWAPHAEYVSKVSHELTGTGVTSLYLTKSQYMEQEAWDNLAKAFRRDAGFQIEESAANHYSEEELNYVERELARNCRYFIAEARSTWSRTVVAMRNRPSRTRERAIQMFFSDEHDP